MIEFKADCGHTVRAKDEDAGGAVRCSYCGRETTVPDSKDDGLDFLFRDIEQPGEAPSGRPRGRTSRRRVFVRRPRTPGKLDPFAIIARMCYAALLISIVFYVGKKYILPLAEEGLASLVGRQSPDPYRESDGEKRRDDAPVRDGHQLGLSISSTPPGAKVYCVEAGKAPSTGRIQEVAGCKQARAVGEFLRLTDGEYVVEVVLAWNDPSLNDPNLPYYERYREFRRAVEHASCEERLELLEEYFVPDEADRVFIDQTEEQIYIVRQYRGVRIRNGRSEGVRALFLPRIVLAGQKSFSIGRLVTDYIPKERAYKFSDPYVRNELDYYGVPESDRLFVIEALARIGVTPYVTPDGHTRLFKIGMHDGTFTAKVVREANQ